MLLLLLLLALLLMVLALALVLVLPLLLLLLLLLLPWKKQCACWMTMRSCGPGGFWKRLAWTRPGRACRP
jgi:hypothetical protein